jgi:hypothetical protein
MPVDERPIPAVQVRYQEPVGIGRITNDPGVIAADQVLPVRVETDLSVRLSPDQNLAETLKGNLLHLIGFRPTQVTNDDTRHVASLICQVELVAHLSPRYTRVMEGVLRNIFAIYFLPVFLRNFDPNCAY